LNEGNAKKKKEEEEEDEASLEVSDESLLASERNIIN
jgi:hypothetical protein